jgi:bifunctional enzyme CysN/CysC
MDIVVVGHVDHGKSTMIGRLLADTDSLPEGKLKQVRAACAANARPFEYAFLLDALKNEQAQGITIDTARCFFKTEQRHYIIHDAPGHVEFLKNMITGASRAQAALLVIDAQDGVQENSRRHGYILSMLGIRQVAVLVNKMDLLGWDEAAFETVVAEYGEFLGQLGVHPTCFIPISAREGSNVVHSAAEFPWYDGPTVLEQIEQFVTLDDDLDRPFRMPLQDVYKFTASSDDRRIFVGTVETGRVRPGDDIVFLPSGKTSNVKSIEVLEGQRPAEAYAGQATGLTLDTQVYVKPGELVARVDEPLPTVTSRFRATVFWMGSAPLASGRRYLLRAGAARVPVELDEVLSAPDASKLHSAEGATQVERHELAEVIMATTRPFAFDPSDALEQTSRFVLVSGYDIAGCGIALEALGASDGSTARERRYLPGSVGSDERAQRYRHAGHAVVFAGGPADHVRETAELLERRLFDLGTHSYFLGAGDQGDEREVLDRDARLENLGEIAWAMADAGVVVVEEVGNLDRFDLARLRRLAAPHELLVVGMGPGASDLGADVELVAGMDVVAGVERVLRSLTAVGVLPEYLI